MKLPLASFPANTKIKRSTGFSAFELMFGRICDPTHLLKLSNTTSVHDNSEKLLFDEDTPLAESHCPFDVPIESVDETMNELRNIRTQNEIEARMNIKIEQFRQKKT